VLAKHQCGSRGFIAFQSQKATPGAIIKEAKYKFLILFPVCHQSWFIERFYKCEDQGLYFV